MIDRNCECQLETGSLRMKMKFLGNAVIAIGYHPKQSDVNRIISMYEHQNQIIMRRQNAGVIQFEAKNTDRRKNVCSRVPCLTCSSCYIGETSQWWDERVLQHKRSVKTRMRTTVFTCFQSVIKKLFCPVTLFIVNKE